METYVLKEDLKVFCVTAKSFPYQIKEAFATLIATLPSIHDRTFFGVSYQSETGEMIYKAAVKESFENEGKHYGCENYVIQKGEYLTETLQNWKKDESQIGLTFRKLANSSFETTFPCVEWYKDDDVMCMVRIE